MSGFSAAATGIEIPSKLLEWQASADPRLWKLIISPEFGERLDLQRLTRDVMGRMETDLHMSLEWVAAAHFNTEHPHVHVALRGVDASGEAFKLDRDYIRNGLRAVAQHFATVQLGYRTEQDASLAFRRQIPLQRFTPLDRLIVARTQPLDGISGDFRVTVDPALPGLGPFAAVREQSLASRLMTLQTMGLARPDGPHQWQVRRDLETALKAMKRAADNQKTLAAHGALLSDPRLQLSAPN
jgi:type IV secretory pathway VirD2 relaxase